MSARAAPRMLDAIGGVRVMTWVMAITLFLTILAAAGGLAAQDATRSLARQLEGRLTVQIIDGDAARRDATARRALALLQGRAEVVRARLVAQTELAQLVRPWLGGDVADLGLPMPAMIDVDLRAGDAAAALVERLQAIAPTIRIERHEGWMTPVSNLLASLAWLAWALVLLMLATMAAVVTLAARAGLEAHRATIAVMHMLGATDSQIARLFQRRIAADASLGGSVGAVAALGLLLAIGMRLAGLSSTLLASATLAASDWAALALVPLAFLALAIIAARVTVIRALRRTL